MSLAITRPTGLALRDWGDCVSADLRNFGVIATISGDDWQSWGAQLCGNPSLGFALPDPYQFIDWRVWGERLCDVLA